MRGFFNYDNPVWRFIGKFWDVLILHILWIICSIPLFTIGASTTALYYVTLKLARDDDGYTIKSFFHSFKQNFKQATAIWMIFVAVGIILAVDLWFALFSGQIPAGTMRMVFTALFIGLLIIWVAMITYVFPVLARFYGTVKQTILNAFLLSVRYIFYTIGIIAIDLAIVYLMLTSMAFLMMFGIALIAFANSYFLERLFKKFIPEDDPNIQEVRPLFMDENTSGEEASVWDTLRAGSISAVPEEQPVTETEAGGQPAAEPEAGSQAEPETAGGGQPAAEPGAGSQAEQETAGGGQPAAEPAAGEQPAAEAEDEENRKQ